MFKSFSVLEWSSIFWHSDSLLTKKNGFQTDRKLNPPSRRNNKKSRQNLLLIWKPKNMHCFRLSLNNISIVAHMKRVPYSKLKECRSAYVIFLLQRFYATHIMTTHDDMTCGNTLKQFYFFSQKVEFFITDIIIFSRALVHNI